MKQYYPNTQFEYQMWLKSSQIRDIIFVCCVHLVLASTVFVEWEVSADGNLCIYFKMIESQFSFLNLFKKKIQLVGAWRRFNQNAKYWSVDIRDWRRATRISSGGKFKQTRQLRILRIFQIIVLLLSRVLFCMQTYIFISFSCFVILLINGYLQFLLSLLIFLLIVHLF